MRRREDSTAEWWIVAQTSGLRRPLVAPWKARAARPGAEAYACFQMRPAPGEWDSLRLAAKAADREKAAAKLRPAFESRLKELGYGHQAIADAFSVLTGPGTVAEALAVLAQNARSERSRAVALDFETVEQEPSLPVGHSLMITGVVRHGDGIRIRYAIRPPLPPHAPGPRGQARDDCDYTYDDIGGALSTAEPVDRTTGFLAMPLPQPRASVLRVRMSWSHDATSVWEMAAHELRITL